MYVLVCGAFSFCLLQTVSGAAVEEDLSPQCQQWSFFRRGWFGDDIVNKSCAFDTACAGVTCIVEAEVAYAKRFTRWARKLVVWAPTDRQEERNWCYWDRDTALGMDVEMNVSAVPCGNPVPFVINYVISNSSSTSLNFAWIKQRVPVADGQNYVYPWQLGSAVVDVRSTRTERWLFVKLFRKGEKSTGDKLVNLRFSQRGCDSGRGALSLDSILDFLGEDHKVRNCVPKNAERPCPPNEECVEFAENTGQCLCGWNYLRGYDGRCHKRDDRAHVLREIDDTFFVAVVLGVSVMAAVVVGVFCVLSKRYQWSLFTRSRGGIEILDEGYDPEDDDPGGITLFE